MDLVFQSEYIWITKFNKINRKTPIYYISSIKRKCDIGEIKWHGAWRKYCFFPYESTVWDNKCLMEIINFLNDLNKREN